MKTYNIYLPNSPQEINKENVASKIDEMAEHYKEDEIFIRYVCNFFKGRPFYAARVVNNEGNLTAILQENKVPETLWEFDRRKFYGMDFELFKSLFLAAIALKIDNQRFKVFFEAIKENQMQLHNIEV